MLFQVEWPLDRVSFINKLGTYKIPAINIQAEEIEKEVEAVKYLP